jgi:hypothetical protein
MGHDAQDGAPLLRAAGRGGHPRRDSYPVRALGHEAGGDAVTGSDIFNGLVVAPGLLTAARYVPSERVAAIEEGVVRLTIAANQFDRLNEHTEPPRSERFRAP